jgi:hypothetical protein
MTPRSRFSGNTAFGLVGMAVFVASIVVGQCLPKNVNDRAVLLIGFVGFGLGWLVIGAGQLVTGHAWQNLADRNEGPHRSEDPKRFWGSVALAVAVCLASCAFAIYKYHAR